MYIENLINLSFLLKIQRKLIEMHQFIKTKIQVKFGLCLILGFAASIRLERHKSRGKQEDILTKGGSRRAGASLCDIKLIRSSNVPS